MMRRNTVPITTGMTRDHSRCEWSSESQFEGITMREHFGWNVRLAVTGSMKTSGPQPAAVRVSTLLNISPEGIMKAHYRPQRATG